MKGTFFTVLIVVFSLLAIPIFSLSTTTDKILPVNTPQSNIAYNNDAPKTDVQTFKVLIDDKICEYSVNDYIFGVVAAEMPALYHPEAIKAQAVAAYTFAIYRKSNNTNSQYDISADPNTAQCFITREQARDRWGEKAEEYTKKLDECITGVSGELLTFDNQPIFAAYHAISSGKTNNCQDIWGNDLSYLVSVDSVGDPLAEGYLSETIFSTEELCEKLKNLAEPTGEEKNYFSNIKTTPNGYVSEITYCNKVVTGYELSKILGLRSGNFEISFVDNCFKFTVKGYGHGVGMSQNGANYLAQQGYSYEEILLHYYSGATLQKN